MKRAKLAKCRLLNSLILFLFLLSLLPAEALSYSYSLPDSPVLDSGPSTPDSGLSDSALPIGVRSALRESVSDKANQTLDSGLSTPDSLQTSTSAFSAASNPPHAELAEIEEQRKEALAKRFGPFRTPRM